MKFRKVIRPTLPSDLFFAVMFSFSAWVTATSPQWTWRDIWWVFIIGMFWVKVVVSFWNCLVIDDEGITRRYFFKSSRVQWADIARLEKIDGFLSARIIFDLRSGVPRPLTFSMLDDRYCFYTGDFLNAKLFKTVRGLWEREHASELSHT